MTEQIIEQTGYVESLFLKKVKGSPLSIPPDRKLRLHSRFGIEDDANASPSSPRQVLLTSLKTLRDFDLKPGDLRENIAIGGFDIDEISSGCTLLIEEKKEVDGRASFHFLNAKPVQHITAALRYGRCAHFGLRQPRLHRLTQHHPRQG